MILGFITLIALIVASNNLNLVDENLIQVLHDNHRHTSLIVDDARRSEANNNQTFEIQNNIHLGQIPTSGLNVELNPIVVAANTEYRNIFIDRYSNFAINC